MATSKIVLSPSRDIPFNKLVLSQANVRKVKAGVSIEDLAEDIARRTLLHGLAVRPVLDAEGAETGVFEVPVGGRRFRALELLVKQKRMSKTQPVPCVVRDAGLAEEDSLAENVQRAEAAPADRHLENAGLGPLGVEHRPDGEAVQQSAAGDVLGEVFDRDAGLDAAEVRLGQHQRVEGDVARSVEDDLGGGGHGNVLHDGAAGSLSPDLLTRHPIPRHPLPLRRVRAAADPGRIVSRPIHIDDDAHTPQAVRTIATFCRSDDHRSVATSGFRQEGEQVIGGLGGGPGGADDGAIVGSQHLQPLAWKIHLGWRA